MTDRRSNRAPSGADRPERRRPRAPEGDVRRGRVGHDVVVFGARRRPEDATEIRLPEWEGPLGLLLALVEARRLDVLGVPLGALAEAYLDALATLEGDRLGNISAFVGVASQLILIKSRALLPRQPAPGVPLADEGADPEAELRARLLLYRAFRDAGAVLQARALTGALLVRREPGVAAAAGRTQAVAPDAPPLDVALLVRALERPGGRDARAARASGGRAADASPWPSGRASSAPRSRRRARSCSRTCWPASATGWSSPSRSSPSWSS